MDNNTTIEKWLNLPNHYSCQIRSKRFGVMTTYTIRHKDTDIATIQVNPNKDTLFRLSFLEKTSKNIREYIFSVAEAINEVNN